MDKSCEDSKGVHFEESDPRHYDTLNIMISNKLCKCDKVCNYFLSDIWKGSIIIYYYKYQKSSYLIIKVGDQSLKAWILERNNFLFSKISPYF